MDAVKKSDSLELIKTAVFFRNQWVTIAYLFTNLRKILKYVARSLARSLFWRSPTDAETVAAVSLFSDAAAALAVDRLSPAASV